MRFLALVTLSFFLISSVSGEGCGGLVEGDGGQVEIPAGASGGATCVWIVKLLHRTRVRFTLDRIGNGSVVSLYPEHEPTETVLNPIRLQGTDIGATIETVGKRLLVVLTQNNGSRDDGLAFRWDSVEEDNSTAVVEAASYVDTPEGRIVWTRFGQQERLTWALSLESSSTLEWSERIAFGRCDLIDACSCTYFALYEVNPEGYLREVSRVCGRVSEGTVKNLYPQLVAFVYVNSTVEGNSNSTVEIEWSSSSGGGVTPTAPPGTTVALNTTSSYNATETFYTTYYPTNTTFAVSTTTPSPGLVYRECGGVVNVSTTSYTYIEYKLGQYYDNDEICIWTLNSADGGYLGRTIVTIEQQGFESCCDGLMGFYVSDNNNYEPLRCSLTNGTCDLLSAASFLVFTSDQSVTGSGFRARLIGFPLQTTRSYSTFFFDAPSGSFRYPQVGSYDDYEIVTAVVQQNTTNFLEVTYLDLETAYDYLYFYTIYPLHQGLNVTRDSNYTGVYPDGVPGSYSKSNYSRLVLFTSDYTNVRTGFSVFWSETNNTTAVVA